MGFSENVNASAPEEENKKCWLKVTYNSKSRLVEWRTNEGSFKDMNIKVKKVFGLHDKLKLVYTYHEPTSSSKIVMSSDEELATALHFMVGEVLVVDAIVDRKAHKNVLCRAYRYAKAQKPILTQFMANAYAYARENVAIYATRLKTCMNQCGNARRSSRAVPSQANGADSNSNSRPSPCSFSYFARRPHCNGGYGFYGRTALFIFILLLSLFAVRMKIHKRLQYEIHEAFQESLMYPPVFRVHQPIHHQTPGHVTILAATYGGLDVTSKAREYYNRGMLKPSNEIFGDTLPGVVKYLHVVYQHYSHGGYAEVFSQTFQESSGPSVFTMQRESCAYPEEAIVDGKSIKILGALYDDVGATCAARRMASTGQFSASKKLYSDSLINRNHFGSNSGTGTLTIVYMRDNVLRISNGREGQSVHW